MTGTLATRRSAAEVIIGAGAAMAAIAEAGCSERWAVVSDPAVQPFVDRIIGGVRIEPVLAVSVVGERASRMAELRATARRLVEEGITTVLAVGGGSVLDHAKLSGAVAASRDLAEEVAGGARRCGYVPLRSGHRLATRVVAVPTTVGTGSDVSAVACVEEPHGYKTLVAGRTLRPALAALDPDATSTLPHPVLVEGTLEILLRVIGPFVGGPSSHPLADASVRALLPVLIDHLDRSCPTDAGARLAIASASHETHAGWLLHGRSCFPSPLWYLANELAPLAGVRKVPASLRLLGPWLERVCSGDPRWGNRAAAVQALDALGIDTRADVAAQIGRRLYRWCPTDGSLRPIEPEQVARRAIDRWGGRLPMLGRFSDEELAGWVADAVRPQGGGGGGDGD